MADLLTVAHLALLLLTAALWIITTRAVHAAHHDRKAARQ